MGCRRDATVGEACRCISSHPTRVVAGVDILRHTSAHKGNPLFRRRAPAPSTVDQKGLRTARAAVGGRQGVRGPFAMDGMDTDQGNGGECGSGKKGLLIPQAGTGQSERARRCRRGRVLGIPAGARDGCRAGGVAAGAGASVHAGHEKPPGMCVRSLHRMTLSIPVSQACDSKQSGSVAPRFSEVLCGSEALRSLETQWATYKSTANIAYCRQCK